MGQVVTYIRGYGSTAATSTGTITAIGANVTVQFSDNSTETIPITAAFAYIAKTP